MYYFKKIIDLSKSLIYKNIRLLFLSFFISFPSVLLAHRLVEEVFEQAEFKFLILPVVIETFMLLIYILMNTMDFVVGYKASLHRGESFNHSRLLDTFAKLVSVTLITFMMMSLALASEAVNSKTLWYTVCVAQCSIWVLANFYEFGSIGENIKILRGRKPNIFKFFDKVIDHTEKRIINNFKKCGDQETQSTIADQYNKPTDT